MFKSTPEVRLVSPPRFKLLMCPFKGLLTLHVQMAQKHFFISLFRSDLDEKDIIAKLTRATASHGRTSAKARFQGAASQNATPGSVAGAQQNITAERKFEPQRGNLIEKEASDSFWSQQRYLLLFT